MDLKKLLADHGYSLTDAEQAGRGFFFGLIDHMEKTKRDAYHKGLRDGLILKQAYENKAASDALKKLRVDDLELSTRASNCLKMAGIETLDQFMALTQFDVMDMKNAGRRTWMEVRDIQAWLARKD